MENVHIDRKLLFLRFINVPHTQNLLDLKFKIEYASIIKCQSSNC